MYIHKNKRIQWWRKQLWCKYFIYLSRRTKGNIACQGLCKDLDDKFVAHLGDNVLRKDLLDYTKFQQSNYDAMILLCKVDEPSRFGIAELDKNNQTIKNIWKTKKSTSNLVVIGVYFLTPKIFDIIKKLKPSWRDELEITDALQSLINKGSKIEYDIVTGWWKDIGTPEDSSCK